MVIRFEMQAGFLQAAYQATLVHTRLIFIQLHQRPGVSCLGFLFPLPWQETKNLEG